MTYIVENSETTTLIVHSSLEEKGRQLAEKAGWVALYTLYKSMISVQTC